MKNKRMFKVLSVFSIMVITSFFCVMNAAADDPPFFKKAIEVQPKKIKLERNEKLITILQTSDIHHHASGNGPFMDYTPNTTGDDNTLGGYARLSTLINQIRKAQSLMKVPVLLVDSGDFFMETTYDITGSDPAIANPAALKFFQQMKYDAITLGNHEFDWGPQGLSVLLSGGIRNGFTIPVLATNTVFNDDPTITGDDDLKALGILVGKKVLNLHGIRVGLIGLLGPNADQNSPMAKPVTFNHQYDFIQSCVDNLRNNDKVDLVIVLSHGGIKSDGSGDDADLAANVSGIDIIASGHYHTQTNDVFVKGPSNTIIFEPGEYGEWLSRIDIIYDKKIGCITAYDFSLLLVDDNVPGDCKTQRIVDKYNDKINKSLTPLGVQLDTPVLSTDFPLEMASFQITGLGSLCADADRYVANSAAAYNFATPVDVGLVANGVIRDLYPSDAGVISFADVYNCLPFGISPNQPTLPGSPG